MPSHSFAASLLGGTLLLFVSAASAQGGVFRGPEPMASAQFPSPMDCGMLPGSRAPAGSGPVTGGPGGAGGVPAGQCVTVGDFGQDLSSWMYWWEFNKDSYLGAMDGGRGGAARHRGDISAAVAHTLVSASDPMIQQACLMALAKSREDMSDRPLVDALSAQLRSPSQRVRETVPLALGIAGRLDNGTLDRLIEFALDREGARVFRRDRIDNRTRAFACYGLGLLANCRRHVATKRAVFTTMSTVLGDATVQSRELQVAAIQAIGLLDPGDATPEALALQRAAAQCLLERYDRASGQGDELVQAHCPTAIAKLFRRGAAAAAPYAARFASGLRGEDANHADRADIHRSCAIALGMLCSPPEAGGADAGHNELLAATRLTHADPQTRGFATVALGQIGGSANRALLLAQLDGRDAKSCAWCALALGVLVHEARTAAARRGEGTVSDARVGSALAALFSDASDPELVSALAIALGLARHQDAVPAMTALLRRDLHREAQAGYVCVGLALMQRDDVADDLFAALDSAWRRPDLLRCCTAALGLLRESRAIAPLLERLANESWNLHSYCALATALGRIADGCTVEQLERLLDDSAHHDGVRSFAAVALGSIADQRTVHWSAKLAANLNYRAAVETLTNGHSGVLDLP